MTSAYPLFEVIILSYARPQNMNILLEEVLKIDRPLIITISNNNPDIDLTKYIQSNYLEKINLIQNKKNSGPINRILVAKESAAQYFVSIDDDMFMKAAQIELLMDHLLINESVPHGCHQGQVLDTNVIKRVEIDGEVDILNSVYAYTRVHVDKFFQIMDTLKIDTFNKSILYEDIILSFCGISRPLCHNLGFIVQCKTNNSNVAISVKTNNFAQIRFNFFLKISKLKLIVS